MASTLLLVSAISLLGVFVLRLNILHLRKGFSLGAEKRELFLKDYGVCAKIKDFLFPSEAYEALYFSLFCVENLLRFIYFLTALGFVYYVAPGQSFTWQIGHYEELIVAIVVCLIYLAVLLFIGDLLARVIDSRLTEGPIKLTKYLTLLLLIIFSPISILLLLFSRFLPSVFQPLKHYQSFRMKNVELLLDQFDLDPERSDSEKEMIRSLVGFQDRIVREVMIPRVDVFSLPEETTIAKAAEKMAERGYSRIPIYQENVDGITGILMYKDLFRLYLDVFAGKLPATTLEKPVESLVKPPFYTPETKKVSQLLQEFQQKQTHMAVVVDEYGGTEGIVTIEDILEEIVGEIEDEYDIEEEELFVALPNGGWIVDAKMNLLDVKEKFDIEIPSESDYDTLGGYVFFRAGTIPSKGFRIHHDDFDIEIVQSDERRVHKVKIYPADPAYKKEES